MSTNILATLLVGMMSERLDTGTGQKLLQSEHGIRERREDGRIMHSNASSYYTPNEHGRELLGLPPTKISYAAGTDYITCAECPHCKPKGIREDGFLGAGYQYGICGQCGNLVFLEPWKEKRIHGNGYIHHKVSSCERYEKRQSEKEDEVYR